MEYRKDELEKIKERTAIINENLGRCGIFPDRNEPTKSLSRIQETILKVTFELRVAFLEPMTFLFSWCISAAVLEKTIIELEKQGYIESRTSKDLGKCWCLTSKALYYITQKQDKPYKANDVPSDNIPKDQKLILYKCINSYYAMRVFETMNFYLWNKFKGLEKSYRVNYSKSQYLVQCEFQKGKKGYSKREADKFVKANIDTIDMDRYHEFTKYCKDRIMEDSLLMHSYLKEYASVGFATAENSKEGIENRTPCPPKRVRLTVAVEFFFSFRFASQKGLRHRTKLAFCETSPALLCNVAKFLECCRRKESGVLCHCFKYVISVVAVIDKFFMGSAYAFAVKFFHEL